MRKIEGYFCEKGRFHLTKALKTKFGVVEPPFKSDGFSIPWYLRWFHNPFGAGLAAAIWHDFALKNGDKLAHIQFLDLLLDYAFSLERKSDKYIYYVKAYIMYFVVVGYAYYKAFRQMF